MSDLRDFFENLLFRSLGSQRFIQDSPVFPEVWLDFALHPSDRRDLLLTPTTDHTAQQLAAQLRERLQDAPAVTAKSQKLEDGEATRQAQIAANMTTVAARLTFKEVICCLLPMTAWWEYVLWYHRGNDALDWFYDDSDGFASALERALAATSYQSWIEAEDDERKHRLSPVVVWILHVAGTILIAETEQRDLERGGTSALRTNLETLEGSNSEEIRLLARTMLRMTEAPGWQARHDEDSRMEHLEEMARDKNYVVRCILDLFAGIRPLVGEQLPMVRSVNSNRRTEATVYRSCKTTKADAVRQVFDVQGRRVRWAVIDSGIDARHVAFRRRHENGKAYGKPSSATESGELDPGDLKRKDPPGSYGGWAFCKVQGEPGDGWLDQTRIVATYDFTRIRELLSITSDREIPEDLLVRARNNRKRRRKKSRRSLAASLRRSLKFGSMIDWGQLEDFLQVPHNDNYEPPRHYHGTHVAGIIGACWRADEHELSPSGDRTGIAPQIELYDLRALDGGGGGDEFSIMAAMQFVRYLNLHKTGKDQMEVHGANLSFAIKHEVANFACGRTPVCDEADRLVGSGVVVVAAAGNQGRARYQTVKDQTDEGYRSISVTDPGNAQSVITVGATHNSEPHTYGVSYFSSRGPTGDGRPKPDLVAPGEDIYSTVPGNAEANTDGTSQAAPHVSGAAALLMERNVELIADPARIKKVLCEQATDLGRERYFQGAGMLDILRAMQAV